MATYQWKGISAGTHTEGQIEAANRDEATNQLKSQQIIITALECISGEESGEGAAEGDNVRVREKKVKNKELMIFTKKLATMVESGLPILKTLQMLESQAEDKYFKHVVGQINKEVESGSTLSDAFAKFPKLFDTVYINLLRAGETSGKLTIFLQRLVIQLEKAEKIRSKVKSALTYPIILIIVAVVVILVMLIKVVPVFQEMFSSVGHDLPGPTQLIITVSEFLREPAKGGILFVVLFSIFMIARYLVKNNLDVKRKFDRLTLKIPIIGDIIMKSTLAKIAMIEGNLSAAGVSVLDSLDIIGRAVSNTLYKESLVEIKDGVSAGNPISTLYSMYPEIYPPTFSQMLAVGEETGNMDDMFEATSRYYEEEFDMIVDRLTEILEPFMIVFMGLTIGFIIVAMYLPIFQIGQTMMGGGH